MICTEQVPDLVGKAAGRGTETIPFHYRECGFLRRKHALRLPTDRP